MLFRMVTKWREAKRGTTMRNMAAQELTSADASASLAAKPAPWVEIGLTLPIFLFYHLGVIFLGIQNATDFLTRGLLRAADGDTARYLGLTGAIAAVFAAVFAIAGRGQGFAPRKFLQIACEGVVYAVIMRICAGFLVTKVFAGPPSIAESSRFTGMIMALGAGFYEELAFRAILFGLGLKALVWALTREKVKLLGARSFRITVRSATITVVYGLLCAALFSGMHYIGELSDPFDMKSFFFRAVLGLALTIIYATRGFAAAVWTHALYDIWVLVLR